MTAERIETVKKVPQPEPMLWEEDLNESNPQYWVLIEVASMREKIAYGHPSRIVEGRILYASQDLGESLDQLSSKTRQNPNIEVFFFRGSLSRYNPARQPIDLSSWANSQKAA